MKTLQVSYKTKSGNWLCDINFIGEEEDRLEEDLFYEECDFFKPKIETTLKKRYGDILDWSIEKFYN